MNEEEINKRELVTTTVKRISSLMKEEEINKGELVCTSSPLYYN